MHFHAQGDTTVTAAGPAGGLIDVHAHFVRPGPKGQVTHDFPVAEGYTADADPVPEWSPEAAISFMDSHGIQMQLLSHPRALSPDAARKSNDYAADVVRMRPRRFGLLANLPLGSPGDALAEIRRASEVLHADGFLVVTNYDGVYLGNRSLEPVFAELDERRATVLLHPVKPAGFDAVSCGRPGPVIEFPFDTARSVVDAIYSRVFARFPNFNMVLAHGGGPLPALTPRIGSIGTHSWVPRDPEVTGELIERQIAGLYYDTAIAGTPCSLVPLLEVTSADHLLFGTDFPPAGIAVIDSTIESLAKSHGPAAVDLDETTRTALALFPSLAERYFT